MYRYILRESCSQFDLLPLTSLTISCDVPIPIFIAMKALGVESDQEVVSLIGPEMELQARLDASLREASITHGVHTQVQAQRWIGGHLQPGRGRSFKRSKVDEAREVMNSVIVPHVPVVSYDFRDKAIYVGLMVRRCLMAMDDPRHLSDKVSCLLCTVIFHANHADNLTLSP